MAVASIKLPINKKIKGLAKGANAFAGEITPNKMANTGPKRALTGMGTGSVIHQVAIKAINNWGFKYKTVAFTWNKKRGFMGKWTVKQCEICLLATKGTAHKLLKSFKEKSYLEENKTEHSKKPNEFRKRIERMFGDVPKLEMFARTRVEGWDAWGNETDKFEEKKGGEIFNNSFPPQTLFGDVK